MWKIKPILKCCFFSKYHLTHFSPVSHCYTPWKLLWNYWYYLTNFRIYHFTSIITIAVKISTINKLKFTENKGRINDARLILCFLLVQIFCNINKTLLNIKVNSNICHPITTQYGINQPFKRISILQLLS